MPDDALSELLPDWDSSHNHLVQSLNISTHTINRHRFDNLVATATQCECVQPHGLIHYASSCHVSEKGTFTRSGAVLCFLKKNMSNMPETRGGRRKTGRVYLKSSEAYARSPSHPPSHTHAAQRAHWLVPNDLVCDARYTKHWHTSDEWLI